MAGAAPPGEAASCCPGSSSHEAGSHRRRCGGTECALPCSIPAGGRRAPAGRRRCRCRPSRPRRPSPPHPPEPDPPPAVPEWELHTTAGGTRGVPEIQDTPREQSARPGRRDRTRRPWPSRRRWTQRPARRPRRGRPSPPHRFVRAPRAHETSGPRRWRRWSWSATGTCSGSPGASAYGRPVAADGRRRAARTAPPCCCGPEPCTWTTPSRGQRTSGTGGWSSWGASLRAPGAIRRGSTP